MKADRLVFVGDRRLHLCRHAAERYQERVRPALGFAQVLAELDAVLRQSTITGERPEWAVGSMGAREWVVVNESICFPILNRKMVTCLTRNEFGGRARIVRAELRQDIAAGRSARGARKKHGKVARAERKRAQERRDAAA